MARTLEESRSGTTPPSSLHEKIPCPHCGKNHRSEEAIARCAAKAERKALRESKKEEDRARRFKNSREEPPQAHIKRLRQEGKNLEQVLGSLRKNYPPPEFEEEWDLVTVAYEVAAGLNWGPVDVETKAMMLLEKHFLGAYATIHPMELVHFPGATPIARVTGEDYRLERVDAVDS